VTTRANTVEQKSSEIRLRIVDTLANKHLPTAVTECSNFRVENVRIELTIFQVALRFELHGILKHFGIVHKRPDGRFSQLERSSMKAEVDIPGVHHNIGTLGDEVTIVLRVFGACSRQAWRE
jgi:hypothetical protein